MARWTVVDGDQELVIEADAGVVVIDIRPAPPFTTGPDGVRDIRGKLGQAIGIANNDEKRMPGVEVRDDRE